jgi:DNA-directed RNA polymerase specialized sigma24 family protein
MSQDFWFAAQDIVDPNSPCAKALFCNIGKRLRQYNLHNQFMESDILHEALCRAHKKYLQGEEIINYYGFIRSISFNIIFEKVRAGYANGFRIEAFEEGVTENLSQEKIDQSFDEDRQLIQEAYARALSLISPEERLILELRLQKNLPWKQVEAQLAQREIYCSEINLRRKFSRIIEKLRKQIHVILPSERMVTVEELFQI